MSSREFHCVFSEEMNAYLNYQVSSGYKAVSFHVRLRQFDRFCVEQGIQEPVFTTKDAAKWMQKFFGISTCNPFSV